MALEMIRQQGSVRCTAHTDGLEETVAIATLHSTEATKRVCDEVDESGLVDRMLTSSTGCS